MRPAEVIHLRLEQCHLPETGWGMLNLSGGVITAGKEWTDDGAVHEVHSLKRRAATATRPVPIPPQFVRILRGAHQTVRRGAGRAALPEPGRQLRGRVRVWHYVGACTEACPD
ncbi:hypothetical protein ACFVYL_23770, partial [Streptomyces sp. NPDC058308]